MKRYTGFTLIEFIAVVALVGALALVISPNVARRLHSGQLEQVRHELKQVVRKVQQQAIAENRSYRIIWNIAANRYEVYYNNGASFVLSEQETLPNYTSLSATTFPSNQVDFDNFGSPSSGGTVTLLDTSGANRQLSIVAGSGIVSLP